MTGSGTETLTAALRRLADERASGLLSVATEDGQDVVLELADGVPVGIGPAHDVSGRVGRDAGAGLVAAAVVDELVDRTVAAIVGGGGDWTWDVTSDASLMPLPPDLATELSRRAVDAAQALAELGPDVVLQQARPLETHGEVGRVRELFDGERRVAEVAELAELTVPATATHAMALVAAGVLSTGLEPEAPTSWTDAVAGSNAEGDEDDEPELWVMDPPEDEPEPDDQPDRLEEAPAHGASVEGQQVDPDEVTPAATSRPAASAAPANAAPGAAPDRLPRDDEDESEPEWADTRWLDDLDDSPDDRAFSAGVDESPDARAALSSMLSELQGPADGLERPTREPSSEPSREPEEPDKERDEPRRATPSAKRKEPKAEPGEVAEFLRELSRLALDDE